MRPIHSSRFGLSLLLAASTAVTVCVPPRACACPSLSFSPASRQGSDQLPSQGGSRSTPDSGCCSSPSVRSCCSAKAKAAACCCHGAKTATTAPSHDRDRPAASEHRTACGCIHCDCAVPMPASAPAAPSAPDVKVDCTSFVPQVLSSSPISTVLLAIRASAIHRPIDLVISLSRLTC